ncbi:MAG: hypothetical protein HY903_21995 [Deltaproteobacteria bacterium]|nr:hypothetical protein [Deltaproteobacteria bacterium]
MKRLRDAAVLLVTHLRYTAMPDEIVSQLATHFVPEVTPAVSSSDKLAWYWRPAWYAIAIALAVLVEYHPRVAAALARPGAFRIPAFHAAILAAERRLAPRAV